MYLWDYITQRMKLIYFILQIDDKGKLLKNKFFNVLTLIYSIFFLLFSLIIYLQNKRNNFISLGHIGP